MTTNKVETTTHNPLDLIREHYGDVNVSHLRYTPGLQSEVVVRSGSIHDGTLLFSWELLADALGQFITLKPQPKWSHVESVQIEMGDVQIEIEIIPGGLKETPCGSGQREIVTIPYIAHVKWKPRKNGGPDSGYYFSSSAGVNT